MEVQNKRLETGVFENIQKEVLAQWPTGGEVAFEDGVVYHQALPEEKVFPLRLAKAKRAGDTLIQPRAGVALLASHIELLRYLETEGEADLLPTTVDSYTRHNRYQEAQKGIEESMTSGRSLLNGFPIVNHGVERCRDIIDALASPVQVRHGTPDARLLAEISLAGGFSSFEGGGISYNIPYAKNNPLENTIRDWQYVDRLVGYYEEAGAPIDREPFGPLTGTMVPPCISHAVAIIESLLAAEQGVKNITVGYGQSGNLGQDVAAIRSLQQLTEDFLQTFGYAGVHVTTVFHQWMGGFPADESKAAAVISWGAAAAALSGATKVIVKTPHEAMGVPTKEANASGLKTTKQLITMLREQVMPLTHELEEEIQIINAETRSILERTMALGEGDVAQGALRAFAAGVIDVPFAPSKYNANRVLPARDNVGAVRFLEFGDLPFDEDIKDFHRQRIGQRAREERRSPNFQMVIDDIYAIGKGRLVGRPRA